MLTNEARRQLVQLRSLREGAIDEAVYFLHTVTGGVGAYSGLVRVLAVEHSLFGVEAVRSTSLFESTATIEEMGDNIAELIAVDSACKCVNLCGYSLGGLLAFECARVLTNRHQRTIGCLAIVDSAIAVSEMLGDADGDRVFWLTFWSGVAGQIPSSRANLSDSFWRMNTRQRLRVILMTGSDSLESRLPKHWGIGELEHYYHYFKMMWGAGLAYKPKPLSLNMVYYETPERGRLKCGERWKSVAGPGSEIVEVLGNHRSVMESPYVDAIAKDLEFRICNRLI